VAARTYEQRELEFYVQHSMHRRTVFISKCDLGVHFSIPEVNLSYGSVIPMERAITFPLIYNSYKF